MVRCPVPGYVISTVVERSSKWLHQEKAEVHVVLSTMRLCHKTVHNMVVDCKSTWSWHSRNFLPNRGCKS